MIYFLQAASGEGPIKIGRAALLEQRIYGVQCMSPVRLTLLATAPGNSREERALHQKLQQHRSHGEWFHPHSEVLAVVASATAWEGDPIHFGLPRVKTAGGYGAHFLKGQGERLAAGRALNEFMQREGLTLADVAKRLEAHEGTVCRIRKGRRAPSATLAKRIKDLVGART